jgi:protein tyrosine/serine phosphatase
MAGTTPPGVWPTNITGVDNFAEVSPHLYRGAQPTAPGYAELKKRGIKTVIDLRDQHGDDHMDPSFVRDAALLKPSAPWCYCHIRETAFHAAEEKTAHVLKVMTGPENWPVYVHCWHGSDRTGTSVAAYRMVVQGWTNAQAIEELHRFGFHTAICGDLLKYLEAFDAARMRNRLLHTPMPHVVLIPKPVTPAAKDRPWWAPPILAGRR